MLSMAAIALWGVSLLGVGGFLWLSEGAGSEPLAVADSREPILVEPDEHQALRGVMQANLVTLRELFDACARDDLVDLAALTRSASEAPGVGRAAPTLRPDLPKKWRGWGKAIHREYALLADALEAGVKDCSDLPETMAAVTASCISCHSTYRIVPPTGNSDSTLIAPGSGSR
jgi:hypothetical protein